MAIELKKKQKFDLTKKEPGLKQVFAGLGWDTNTVNGKKIDCDVSVFMLGENAKVPAEEYFVFYNNLLSADGALRHTGDNRDGAGEGDDETVEVDLMKVSQEIVQILFCVTIHESEERGHTFGDVNNSFIRMCNKLNGNEICRFTLNEQFGGCDSLIIGRLYRSISEWEFEAMGSATGGGLSALVEFYT